VPEAGAVDYDVVSISQLSCLVEHFDESTRVNRTDQGVQR